jgi:CRISPR-associated protein Cas1
MTDETHWPARTVAEYAYCPRLFYYMEVEGVFLPSVDTEKGQAVHRRVNKPSAELQENSDESEGSDRPKIARSLVLTSDKLGLTATLDLAELSGNVAIPVEYRKGAPKRTPIAAKRDEFEEEDEGSLAVPEPWPTDRVQVGLQAVLLEEAGYEVKEAILYYASEKLRLTIAVDGALKSEALATLEAAKACARGARPLPLVNDPRCIRCSLQPICLPDEVNCERSESNGNHLAPRKIWPPRDEGIQIVAQQNGTRVGVKGMALTINDANGSKAGRKEVPLASVDSLSLLGSVQISTQAMKVLADQGIPVALLSAAGRLVAMVDPLDSVSAVVRRKQVLAFESSEKCLELARALIIAKIANQRKLLIRNHPELPAQAAAGMASQATQAAKAESLESLRGYEGQAAAIYFEHFAGMLNGAPGIEFDANGRKRRPPPDPVNSCLSMAYSMLTHECVSALRVGRLEPSIGAYHTSRPGRPALALDLMEPFRPLIADSVAIATFNRGELTNGHFQRTTAGCMFTDAGRKAFFQAYARRMDTEVTHPVFGYKLSYRRMLALHARMIAAWCVGEIETLVFLTTR